MRKHPRMRVYMRTAQTGLILSCSGAVWANLVLFRAKRVGERFVFDVIGWFPCKNIQQCVFPCERLKPGSFGAVFFNSELFRAKRVGERSFSLFMMCLM